MNRRNVLGNQIEASKTVWVVLAGLLVCVLQFVFLYFIGSTWLGLLLGGLCILLGSGIVHFITGEQEELFAYLLIPCTLSGIAGLLIPKLSGAILPEGSTVLIGCLLSWLIPVLYASVCTWAEGSQAIGQFADFYRKAVLFFYIVYFGALIYWFVIASHTAAEDVKLQLIPFASFASCINGLINKTASVQSLLAFLAERLLLFVPYGFFIGMTCRKLHGIVRVLLVVLLPLLVESVLFLLNWKPADIDSIIFAFFGGLIGLLSFFIYNVIFQNTTGKNFNGTEIDRDYYGRKI